MRGDPGRVTSPYSLAIAFSLPRFRDKFFFVATIPAPPSILVGKGETNGISQISGCRILLTILMRNGGSSWWRVFSH